MARILVIDDDGDMRAMMEQTLRSASHEVVSAADGREGVALYRHRPADLVITDLVMPNQEGLETIIELQKEFPHVNVIAMSGMASADVMLSVAKTLGATVVLRKPFFPKQLLSEVEKALHVGEPVWVQCERFRTMAFRDKNGKWRSLATHEELSGVVGVIKAD